jgi:hypothetical protein
VIQSIQLWLKISRLTEDSKVAKQPPEKNKNYDAGAAAAACQLPGSVSGGNAAQQFAHRFSVRKVNFVGGLAGRIP